MRLSEGQSPPFDDGAIHSHSELVHDELPSEQVVEAVQQATPAPPPLMSLRRLGLNGQGRALTLTFIDLSFGVSDVIRPVVLDLAHSGANDVQGKCARGARRNGGVHRDGAWRCPRARVE